MQVTDWFPDVIRPYYPGVYEVALPNAQPSDLFASWDGENWRQATGTVEQAHAERETAGLWTELHDGMRWRGLAQRPQDWVEASLGESGTAPS
jgi:hypothetical protein